MNIQSKKTALVYTLFDKPNYGCFLQAFAMSRVLHEAGYDASFVRLTDKNLFSIYEEFTSSPKNFAIKLLLRVISKLNQCTRKLSRRRLENVRSRNSSRFLIRREAYFNKAANMLNLVDHPIRLMWLFLVR